MMNRREFLQTVGSAAAAFTLHGCSSQPPLRNTKGRDSLPHRPNVLFILADDLGWSQIGCYGTDYYETPHLDRLAAHGMKFTDAYAACPVCSPTRASIMTGKYPARLHLTDYIAGGNFPHEKYLIPPWQKFLPLEEITLAELFQSVGYATASYGKWHLSIAKKPLKSLPYNPDKQGFEDHIVTYKPSSKQNPETDTHNVELITQKSLAFLEKNQDKPFFLYVTHNLIHNPLKGKKKRVAKFQNKPNSDRPENNPILGAMIEELDTSVGRLLGKLEELELVENTIVIFFSDNGGLEKDARQTPLRSGKANLYEGGIRVPFIVRWPGVVLPGSICREPVISVDFFATFQEIIRPKIRPRGRIDGESLVGVWTQRGSPNREALYFHYPHYHSSSLGPCSAVRAGDYKLIEWLDERIRGEENPLELYNLKEDLGETNNLCGKLPQKANELQGRLEAWRQDVGAQMLTRNPNFNPEKSRWPKAKM